MAADSTVARFRATHKSHKAPTAPRTAEGLPMMSAKGLVSKILVICSVGATRVANNRVHGFKQTKCTDLLWFKIDVLKVSAAVICHLLNAIPRYRLRHISLRTRAAPLLHRSRGQPSALKKSRPPPVPRFSMVIRYTNSY